MQLPLKDTVVCVQYLLTGIEIDPTCVHFTFDHELAPGGYAWIFPKGEGRANVGLGVQADLWQEVAAYFPSDGTGTGGSVTVLGYLTRFIEAQPSLAQGYPVTLVTGIVPLALPPARIVTDGLMLVGDAAHQADPLTGGGIITAMSAGRLAARVAVEAIAAGDTSASFLSRYEDQWRRFVGHEMQRHYRLREEFPPEHRANKQFVRAFARAAEAWFGPQES